MSPKINPGNLAARIHQIFPAQSDAVCEVVKEMLEVTKISFYCSDGMCHLVMLLIQFCNYVYLGVLSRETIPAIR